MWKQIEIDQEWIEKNPKTTEDIKDHCKDVRVLGKKEIKALVSWRKDVRTAAQTRLLFLPHAIRQISV